MVVYLLGIPSWSRVQPPALKDKQHHCTQSFSKCILIITCIVLGKYMSKTDTGVSAVKKRNQYSEPKEAMELHRSGTALWRAAC